jgi:hypothetical protein
MTEKIQEKSLSYLCYGVNIAAYPQHRDSHHCMCSASKLKLTQRNEPVPDAVAGRYLRTAALLKSGDGSTSQNTPPDCRGPANLKNAWAGGWSDSRESG